MILELKYKSWRGRPLLTVALGADGKRYFKEGKRWLSDGPRAREWRAMLGLFRKSDWYGFHLSGCKSNQYLAATCSEACSIMSKKLHNEFGGFPEDFKPSRDERNVYRSSLETYG
jgi:hypothetical protein